MPDLTLHSVTCQRCLVIRVLTNVGVFSVYRKVILSSIDRLLSDNVIEDCVFYADKRSKWPPYRSCFARNADSQ